MDCAAISNKIKIDCKKKWGKKWMAVKKLLTLIRANTKEWEEAQVRYGQLKGDLETKIGLLVGFGGLREELNERGGDRIRNAIFRDLEKMGLVERCREYLEEGGKPIGYFDMYK